MKSRCYLYVRSLLGVMLGVEDSKIAWKPDRQGLFLFLMLGVGTEHTLSYKAPGAIAGEPTHANF